MFYNYWITQRNCFQEGDGETKKAIVPEQFHGECMGGVISCTLHVFVAAVWCLQITGMKTKTANRDFEFISEDVVDETSTGTYCATARNSSGITMAVWQRGLDNDILLIWM